MVMFSYIFFKVLGLATFDIKNEQSNIAVKSTQISFFYSRIGYAYNIVLLISLFGSNFLSVPAVFNINFPNKPQLVKTIFRIRLLAALSVLSVVWIVHSMKQQCVIEIANRAIIVDNILNRFQHLHNTQSIKLRATILFIIQWSIWIILITLDAIAFPKSFGITSIPILIPSFICSWFLMLYAFVLKLLEVRMRCINSVLLKFSNIPWHQPELTKNAVVMEHIRIKDLLAIKRAHQTLYEATRDITECYSFPLFIVIILFCGNLIYSAYYFAQLIINPAKIFSALVAIDSMIYIMMELFPIVIMTTSVTELKEQIDITPDMLFEVMDQLPNTHEMKSQLKNFSLELLHRRMEVTAYDFISLDSSLLHSIAGMVTTYLVILLQIQ